MTLVLKTVTSGRGLLGIFSFNGEPQATVLCDATSPNTCTFGYALNEAAKPTPGVNRDRWLQLC